VDLLERQKKQETISENRKLLLKKARQSEVKQAISGLRLAPLV